MKRFKKILIVVGDTNYENAVERGMELALRNGAEVTLIRPLGQVEQTMDVLAELPGLQNFLTAIRDSKLKKLEEIRQRWSHKALTISTCVPSGGVPFAEIIRQVIRGGHDMVVVTASERPTNERGYFGSLPLHLIRKCPCPVWVVSPDRPVRNRKILAAVDPRVNANEADSLSVLILDLATSLARMDESQLHIAHIYNNLVLEGYEEIRLQYTGEEQQREIDACIQKAADKRKHQLDELLKPYDLSDLDHEVHFSSGWPDITIPALANEHYIDVLILGTVSKGAPQGHWIGTTAENIINRLGCSVIAVKPEGFVSPISLPENSSS